MAFRDILKIGTRVLGATGGALIGGPMGAMAGYSLGATVGDLAAGSPEEELQRQVSITDFNPAMARMRNPLDRESSSMVEVSTPGWSDKITPIADPIVAAAGNLYGAVGQKNVSPTTFTEKTEDTTSKFLKNNSAKKWKMNNGLTAPDVSGVSSSLNETQTLLDNYNKFLENQGLSPFSSMPIMLNRPSMKY